jgi:hypothetical protein
MENREYWKEEEERILKEWADKGQCYELMHARCHEIYRRKNTWFVIPVIIISTLTGTANFAQDKIAEDKRDIFVMTVGSLNIIAAIVTTISQYLKISELNESYRAGSLSWGKFYRNIKTELAKHPVDRMHPSNMLKHYKEEYDRLIEIYPPIPPNIITEFNQKLTSLQTSVAGLIKPEICDGLFPTGIYQMTKEERDLMIKRYQPAEPETETPVAEDIVHIVSPPEPEPEDPKITKFKSAFFKINNRFPTDDELAVIQQELFEDHADSQV